MAKSLPKPKDALLTIIQQARKERTGKRDYAKAWLALMALGLNNVETNEVLYYLEITNEKGEPYVKA